MQGAVHLDLETGSPGDLRVAGVYRYVEDPATRVWGFRYQFDGDPTVWEWRPGLPDPVALLQHIALGGRVTAHNASFERTLWNVTLLRDHPHWPVITVEGQDCTMARAAAIAYPQGLDQLGNALGTDMRKDAEGSKAMRKMMKPRATNADGTYTWWDDAELLRTNMDYCGQDVLTEAEADQKLPPLTARERRVWELDQRINERGVPIDTDFVVRAEALVAYTRKQNDRRVRHLTSRSVPKCSTDAKTIAWLNEERGIVCTSLAKGVIDEVTFQAELKQDDVALEVIQLRKASWKTSTAKYKRKRQCVCADGRIRGLLNYHGAGPGRWAGRLTQPQNYPRNSALAPHLYDDAYLEALIRMLHDLLADSTKRTPQIYEHIVSLFGHLEPLELLSKALRSSVRAEPGNRLLGGDFSNIEGRVNAWIANEAWKIQAFQEYDDKTGPDLYKLAYARSFGVHVEDVSKQDRQLGKVQELALGYQGGVGAFISMGDNYGLNPYHLSGPVSDATNPEQWDQTAAQYHVKGQNKHGLQEREWTALKILVDNWRAANPRIVQSWWDYQDAAIEAVAAPGQVVHPEHTRRCAYYYDGRSLWCVLPCGRTLHYADAYIDYKKFVSVKTGREYTKRQVAFYGVDSLTRQWKKQTLYGGLQCENIVQATARDLMVDAMFKLEERGYPIILTVHDEIVCEVPLRSNHSEGEFAQLMAATDTTIYDGLPVSVGAWEDERYIK